MVNQMQPDPKTGGPKQRIVIERTYQASLDEVWDLWTTKDGIESWWGPEGFRVEVRSMDLRAGGKMRYAMIAVGPEQVAFMKQAGMPLAQEVGITYTEVTPKRRLVFDCGVDFVPGVATYDVATRVELEAVGKTVKLVLTLDPMHDAEWTGRAVMGWEQELGKLARVLDAA